MSKLILKESFYYLIGNIFTQVVNFLIIYVLMRRFSLENFGVYSYVTEYIAIFTFFSDAGLTSYAIREVSANTSKAQEKYISLQGSQLYISATTFVLAVIVSIFLKGHTYLLYVTIMAMGLTFNSLFTPCQAQLIALHKKELLLKRNIADSTGMLIFLGVGLWFSLPLVYFMFLLCARAFINFVFYLWVKYNVKQFSYLGLVKLDFENFIVVLKGCGYFTLGMVANVIYNKIDILMVEKYLGTQQVATFAGASKFVYPFMFISTAVTTSLFPRLVKSFVSDDGFVKSVIWACKLMAVLGLAISSVLYLGSGLIFSTLFGHKYDQSIGIFHILVWYLFIVFLYGPIANALVAAGKIKQLVLVNVFFIFIKILMNIYTIPHYKAEGAALSSIMCEILILIIGVYLFFYKKEKKVLQSLVRNNYT